MNTNNSDNEEEIKSIQLTDKEKEKIKNVVRQMEENITAPQIVKGKVFSGAGFVGNPEKIVFKDFNIGFSEEKTIEITNISLGFNSFKLLPLDDEIFDFFEISYKPCGRIPAGISTSLKLKFTPMVDKDFFSSLKLLSETGMCHIPLECLCKKCIIEVKNPEINFGDVILGQEKTFKLNIESNGALGCSYLFTDCDEMDLPYLEDEEEELVSEDLKQYQEFTEHKVIVEKHLMIDEFKKLKDWENQEREKIIELDREYTRLLNDLKEKQKEFAEARLREAEAEENALKDKEALAKLKKNIKKDPKKKDDKKEEFNFEEEKKKLNIPEENLSEKLEKLSNIIKDKEKYLRNTFILKQVKFARKGQINQYSKKILTFTLNAKYLGIFDEILMFKITYNKQSQFFKVRIKFDVHTFPIYSEKKVHYFNYIVDNQMFRDKLILKNTSNLSYKLQIYQHKATSKVLEINPDLGYIQANSDFEVWIKLKANKEELDKLHKFFRVAKSKDFKEQTHSEYLIPLKISITNIEIPFIVQLSFSLTNDKVVISPIKLDFGKLYVDEGLTIPINIENFSLLPMKFGAVLLPKEIKVEPSVGTILPGDKVKCDVSFKGGDNNIGPRDGELFFKISTELTLQNIKVKYVVEIVDPDLVINPKHLIFPCLAEGEKKSMIVSVKNKTNKSVIAEWLTPPFLVSGLTIMPKVIELEPDSYTTCFIEYESAFRPYNAFSLEKIKEDLKGDIDSGLVEFDEAVETSMLDEYKDDLLERKQRIEIQEGKRMVYNKKELKSKKLSVFDKENDEINSYDKDTINTEKDKDNKDLIYELQPLQEENFKGGKNSKLNPQLEEKVKAELNNALKDQDDKKKKKDEKKEVKKEVKKDKKQLDEEERKRKEAEDEIKRLEKEKFSNRKLNFTRELREREMAMFGLIRHSYDLKEDNFVNNINDPGDFASIYHVENKDDKSDNEFKDNLPSDYFNPKKIETSKFTIPLYFKDQSKGKLNTIRINKAIFEVETHTTEAMIIFDKEELSYGEVSVNTRKTINLGVINRTDKILNLQIKPLLVTNCFQVINSIRPLAPKSSFNYIVEFFPTLDVPYKDELSFYTEKTQSSIKLTGKGVSPEVEVNIDKGIFFMGNTCIGHPLERTFEIRNKSKFTIEFEITSLVKGKKNKSGAKVFTFIPEKGELSGEAKKQIKVIFNGDHKEYLSFFEYILISVANQKTPNYIFISACCWPRSAYVRKYFTPVFFDYNALSKRKVEQDLFSEPFDLNLSETPLVLIFKKEFNPSENTNVEDIEKMTKRKLLLGNCRLSKDQKAEKNSNYEITMPQKDEYFSCDNPKGSINPGFETTVWFSFKKPSPDPILSGINELKGLGQWVSSRVEVRITGGYCPQGVGDLQVFEVILKAYIDQI